ncbi:MAG TPA: hypothetical protein VF622_18705 [Segetibacter sp.]|jgi:hypothetical protein
MFVVRYTKQIITVTFILIVRTGSAQPDPVGEFNKHVAENWKSEFVRIDQYKVKGSPYLLGESFPGSITYKGGKTVSDTKVLYNLHNQKAGSDINKELFEADIPVESFSIVLPEKFGGKTLYFKNSYVYGETKLNSYLNVLEDGGKLAFLKVYKTRLVPDPTNYMIKDLKVFEQYYDYYIYNKKTNSLKQIKLRKKELANEINNDEFFKNFLASNNTDLSNEVNVLRLIMTYNSY